MLLIKDLACNYINQAYLDQLKFCLNAESMEKRNNIKIKEREHRSYTYVHTHLYIHKRSIKKSI